MNIKRIAIIGGTGFVGRTLANRLTRDGYELHILTRNRERNRNDLILLPTTTLIQADVYDPAVLRRHFSGCDAVINLVGILNERGRNGDGFRRVHVDLSQMVLDACRDTGVRRLLHMSALNADAENGPSHYLRTKGEAERRMLAAQQAEPHGLFHVTCFRPSVIFGRHDSFFNRFAGLLKMTPLVFPLACPQARFAPVYVEDVAEAFARSLNRPGSYGCSHDLCGPRVYTLQELVAYTARTLGLRRRIIPLTDVLSRLQAAVFDFVPGKPFSTDNYRSTRVDSVCPDGGDLDQLGISPVTLEGIVPGYLNNRTARARYYDYRSEAGRSRS